MKSEHQTEKAALTFMAFVMSEAAEIMLEHVFKENNFTANDLRHEEKMYYKTFVDGLKKMRIGIQGFNQKTIDKYFQFEKISETDRIRKRANELIRLHCYLRNTVGTDADFRKYEETIKSMQKPEETVVSGETIDTFVLR